MIKDMIDNYLIIPLHTLKLYAISIDGLTGNMKNK